MKKLLCYSFFIITLCTMPHGYSVILHGSPVGAQVSFEEQGGESGEDIQGDSASDVSSLSSPALDDNERRVFSPGQIDSLVDVLRTTSLYRRIPSRAQEEDDFLLSSDSEQSEQLDGYYVGGNPYPLSSEMLTNFMYIIKDTQNMILARMNTLEEKVTDIMGINEKILTVQKHIYDLLLVEPDSDVFLGDSQEYFFEPARNKEYKGENTPRFSERRHSVS